MECSSKCTSARDLRTCWPQQSSTGQRAYRTHNQMFWLKEQRPRGCRHQPLTPVRDRVCLHSSSDPMRPWNPHPDSFPHIIRIFLTSLRSFRGVAWHVVISRDILFHSLFLSDTKIPKPKGRKSDILLGGLGVVKRHDYCSLNSIRITAPGGWSEPKWKRVIDGSAIVLVISAASSQPHRVTSVCLRC